MGAGVRRVPREIKNPEQLFMAPLVTHALGGGLGLSLAVHLFSPQCCG